MAKIDIESVLEGNKAEIDSAMARYVPKRYDKASLEFALGKARYAYDIESASDAVTVPAWDLLSRGGKRWRPALFLLIAESLGADPKKLIDLAIIPELVHNGTLMIDDIEDDSALRRGKPTVHKVFGVDVAINAGNALYYLPLLPLLRNKKKIPVKKLNNAYEIYVQEMINLHFGQGFDIWWHKGKKEPTESEYLQMCAYKTGTLARMAAKLGALFADGTDEQIEVAGRFAEAIGVAFQIQDDILNIAGEKFSKGKGLGEDIHEGKRTLMVIHCLSNAPKKEADRLRVIMNSHPSDQKVIDEAIDIIKTQGSIDYAKGCASKLVSEAWVAFDTSFPKSEAKEKLQAFALYLIERDI